MVSDIMDNISHRAVIRYLGLKGLTPREIRKDMVVTLGENVHSYTRTYVHTHIYACMHIYIHTGKHTCMQTHIPTYRVAFMYLALLVQ